MGPDLPIISFSIDYRIQLMAKTEMHRGMLSIEKGGNES